LLEIKKKIIFLILLSADNSPSRYEFLVAREFFKELGGLFHVVVAIQAVDFESLLRPK